MHELSIIMHVTRKVLDIVNEQHLTKVARITLQIGEFSEVVPGYLRECYPAAVKGTMLEDTVLEIEMIPGNVLCLDCHKVYRFLEHPHGCPYCKSTDKEIISGRDFLLKEIEAC